MGRGKTGMDGMFLWVQGLAYSDFREETIKARYLSTLFPF